MYKTSPGFPLPIIPNRKKPSGVTIGSIFYWKITPEHPGGKSSSNNSPLERGQGVCHRPAPFPKGYRFSPF